MKNLSSDFFGIHWRARHETDNKIRDELEKDTLDGLPMTNAARRLWLDGLKWRKQQRGEK